MRSGDCDHRGAGGQQFLHILIALGMAAARRIGISEFIGQCDLLAALDLEIRVGRVRVNARSGTVCRTLAAFNTASSSS